MAGEFSMNVTNNLTSSLKKINDKLKKLPEEGYHFFVAQTPIKTGNARRNTNFNKSRGEIDASYPYASRLDEGYSKQSPKGMVKPTEEYLKKRATQIMRGK